jgi:hypothetical protein
MFKQRIRRLQLDVFLSMKQSLLLSVNIKKYCRRPVYKYGLSPA